MHKYITSLFLATITFLGSLAQTTAKEWFDKGVSLKTDQKFKDAIGAFKKATGLKAGYVEALHELGWCYNEEASYNDAVNALLKENKAGPVNKANNDFELGYAYKGLKQYEEALGYFTKTIEANADYSLAFKERGETYIKLKMYNKVLDDFNKYEALVTTDITDAVYYYNRGWTENDQAKYADAVKSLKKCVTLDNTYADGFSELGYADYKLELNDDALENYRFAMSLDEKDYHPVLGTADVYYDNLKNYDSAVVYYEKGILIQKKNKTAYYRLGWCYNDKAKYADATTVLKEAVLLDPDYYNARNELGYAYYKLDKYDDALAQFRPVMSHDPKDELSRYYAGFCYYLKNDQDNLKKMIAELRELNSGKYVETLTKYVK